MPDKQKVMFTQKPVQKCLYIAALFTTAKNWKPRSSPMGYNAGSTLLCLGLLLLRESWSTTQAPVKRSN